MSRLRVLHVPFVAGLDDRIEPGILPDGAFSRLENARFNRAGELALRRGWRPVDMSRVDGAGDLTVRDLYSFGGSLVALTSTGQMASYSNPGTAQPWYLDGSGTGPLAPARDIRRIGGMPEERFAMTRASAAITSDAVYGCTAFGATTKAGATPQIRIFRVDTDETLGYQTNIAGTQKVVNLGARFGLVVDNGSELVLYFADPATTGSFGSPVTLVAADVAFFDAATAVTATPAALYVAWNVGGAVSFAAFSTTTGAQIGSTKTLAASGRRGVQLASNDDIVHAVMQLTAGASLELLTFDAQSPYTTLAGPTALLAGQDYSDFRFSVGINAATSAVVAAQDADADTNTAADVDFTVVAADHSVATTGARGGCMLAGGVVVPTGAGPAITTSRDNAIVVQELSTTYTKPWLVAHGEAQDIYIGALFSQPPYAPAVAPDGTCIVLGMGPDSNPIPRLFRVAPAERRQGVAFAGRLYITGGVLSSWGGMTSVDAGLLAPVFISATPSNGAGTLTPSSVYRYRAILRWEDERQNDFQGEVSQETTVTLGASDDTVTLVITVPPSRQRSVFLQSTPTLELFRTEAGGELFYFVSATAVTTTVDTITVVDTTPDASIIDEARLYTEGEFGGTSGRLDNVLPRPSAYVAATRDRLVLAGVDPEYQVSQLAVPGEPVAFTDPGVSGPVALVYFDQADEDVTGVATLDDTIIVGTRDSLFVTQGAGPNFAGAGEFPSPARLPSNVGFYDWRSIAEADEGLWFLGDADKLFLLPRGQGAPAWAGKSVQTRLSDGPVVGAGRDTVDQIVAWAVAAASARLVVRDHALKAWATDTLPFAPQTLVSHDGVLWSASSADGVVWTQPLATWGDGAAGATAVVLAVDTGDVALFGLDGWGRSAGVGVRGTFQAAATIACLISYDQGLTYTSLGSHTITGLAAGEAFQRQWYPARQRGGKFRLRFTMTPTLTTTEGCRLTGFSLFYTTRPGPARLDSAKRL